jgi:hypothetical protein
MMKIVFILTTGTLLTACAGSALEGTQPMSVRNDMAAQTVAYATCTRGNDPFKLSVAPDGSATGRVIAPKPPKRKRPPPGPEFPASLKAQDSKTVFLQIGAGDVSIDAISEALTPVRRNGRVVLRGETIDCEDVKVRYADN